MALVVNDVSKEESDDDESNEEVSKLSLITKKIRKICKNKENVIVRLNCFKFQIR